MTMDPEIEARRASLGAWFVEAQTEMDERLRAIDAQIRRLAEKVEVLVRLQP